jgi:hypothetical protein
VATTLFSHTGRGRALEPVLRELSRWGSPLLREPAGNDSFRTHWLNVPARALTDHRPDQPAIALQLHADGNEDLVIEVKDGSVHTHAGRVDHPTASLAGSPQLLAATLLGELSLRAAVEQGLRLSGEREAVLRILPAERPAVSRDHRGQTGDVDSDDQPSDGALEAGGSACSMATDSGCSG